MNLTAFLTNFSKANKTLYLYGFLKRKLDSNYKINTTFKNQVKIN
jgi:hypothetical protein